MRRGLAVGLFTLAASLPGAAQPAGPRLHRFIPGDLSLGEMPAGVLSAPGTADDFRRMASGTGWSEQTDTSHTPASSVLRPREAWAPNARVMDAETRSPADATLNYREVFSPSVSPFKRTHAYDAVDELGRLIVRDPSLRPLRVGSVPASWANAHVVRFTGDVQVELSANAPTPIPSVAGEQAVLSYRTEPEVALAFFRDSAGNLFARAQTARTVRLSYVLAAPQSAFAAPSGAVPDLAPNSPSLHGAEPAPAVPPFLASGLARVLLHMGIARSQRMGSALDALVRYFRNYRDADLPPSGEGNLYLRLAMGGVGACRHRAYAFVLTLHALGVPARYVGNEAHAWAEVYLAGTGWTRIDLGGWDVRLRDESAARERFVPENSDAFPRPPNYANGYSTGAAAAPSGERHRDPSRAQPANSGLGNDDPQGPSHTGNGASPSPASPANAGDPQNPVATQEPATQTPGAPARNGATPANAAARTNARGPDATEPAEGPEAATEPAVDPAAEPVEMHATRLRLTAVRAGEGSGASVLRGTLLTCEGDAIDETSSPIADLPVVLELTRNGSVVTFQRNGRRESALGTTVTREDGRFSARVMLPVELDAGNYGIRARTPGDAHHRRAAAE